MTTSGDEGGDPPCWAHLGSADDLDGPDGVIWSLPGEGDLNVNRVRLGAAGTIGEHRNDEIDVLVVVQLGECELVVDGVAATLSQHDVALVPCGATRAIRAGAPGVTYLSIHRSRAPLSIARR